MTTISAWTEGTRLRTPPASVTPVLLGTGIVFSLGCGNVWLTVGCLVVALAVQIGVNPANNHSDGVRGTDEHRLGPSCLVGGGENPRRILAAALGLSVPATGVGLVVVIASASWWLVAAGTTTLVAAWFYTGGKRPYGYIGQGVSELTVFVPFGLMATLGTLQVQVRTLPWQAWLPTAALRLLSCALLMINSLRDIPTNTQSGKRILAMRLGNRGARWAYVGLAVAALVLAAVVVFIPWPAMSSSGVCQWLPGFTALLAIWGGAAATIRPVWRGATGRDLIMTLRNTGFLALTFDALLALLFALGQLDS